MQDLHAQTLMEQLNMEDEHSVVQKEVETLPEIRKTI